MLLESRHGEGPKRVMERDERDPPHQTTVLHSTASPKPSKSPSEILQDQSNASAEMCQSEPNTALDKTRKEEEKKKTRLGQVMIAVKQDDARKNETFDKWETESMAEAPEHMNDRLFAQMVRGRAVPVETLVTLNK